MAATKKTPPGIKKPAPRSSKVVPVDPDSVERLERYFLRVTKPATDVVDCVAEARALLEEARNRPVPLREKVANRLESFAWAIARFARWVRA